MQTEHLPQGEILGVGSPNVIRICCIMQVFLEIMQDTRLLKAFILRFTISSSFLKTSSKAQSERLYNPLFFLMQLLLMRMLRVRLNLIFFSIQQAFFNSSVVASPF